MSKKARERSLAENEAKAVARNIRVSPQKLNLVAAMIRGKAVAAARNLVEGGSLTVIATASEPIGGETTVIALDRLLTSAGRFPAVDLIASGTVRPELLVGEDGAAEIARARAEALNGA